MAREATWQEMVDGLAERGVLRSAAVRSALLAVDRAAFVPQGVVGPYRDAPVLLQVGPDGEATSTISQPTMIVLMLEELEVHSGHRVLEVGTASGYNAALLAHLVGEEGLVVTIEIDPSLADAAAARLRAQPNVRCVAADGRTGHPAEAPFDRIVVTAGAAEVAGAWRDQLVDGGRLVVPITGPDRTGRCVTFDKVGDGLVERSSTPCGFVPLR